MNPNLLANLQVQGSMTLADGRREGTLQADAVLEDGVNCLLRNAEPSVGPFYGRDVHLLPGDGHLGGVEDLLHGGGDLRADAVAGNQGHDGGLAADAAQGDGSWCR